VLTIDGAQGEGGGQILRTALALALATGTPFRMERIRAGRARPGLLRQHLTAVEAAAAVGGAGVEGAALGSQALVFRPRSVRPGDYQLRVGTAGSVCLVLQAVLPALLTAGGPSRLALEGGTHNPAAPPFDFLALAFLPLLRRMGARVEATLERWGFYPAGGGRVTVRVGPAARLEPLVLLERGAVRRRRARAVVARLPRSIAERELAVIGRRLGWGPAELEVVALDPGGAPARTTAAGPGPGNVVMLEIESAEVTEVVTGFGERGVRAEAVAEGAAEEARRYLAAGVPAGPHLADQLLLPLALAGAGAFRTGTLSPHATTSIAVLRRFLDVDVRVEPTAGRGVLVEVRPTRT
jgi:RNA 3'-terminal phosphate cyclase (ATP)